MARPVLTLILVRDERVVRADFGARGGLTLRRLERPAEEDLASKVEAALAGSAPARGLAVLASEVFLTTCLLRSAALTGLTAEEARRAVGYEVESLSGRPTATSALAYAELARQGADSSFLVQELDSFELEQLEGVARRSGARLLGVAHPGALRRPLNGDGSWQRIELWPRALIAVRDGGNEPVLIAAHDPRRGWRELVTPWLREGAPCELLLGAPAFAPDAEATAPELRCDLAVDADLERFLRAWAGALREKRAAPLLRPPPRPMPTSFRVALAVLVALLVAGACFAHATLLGQRHDTLRAELLRARERTTTSRALQRSLRDVERELAEADAQLSQLERSEQRLRSSVELARTRLPAILEAIAAQRPEDMVLQSLYTDREGMHLAGLCLGPELPDQLALALEGTASAYGWSVNQARKEATSRNGTLAWEFEIVLRDVVDREGG